MIIEKALKIAFIWKIWYRSRTGDQEICNPVELVCMHRHYISRSIQTRDLLEKILRLELSLSANPTGICASLWCHLFVSELNLRFFLNSEFGLSWK